MIPFKLMRIAKAVSQAIAPPSTQNVQETYTEGDSDMTLVLSASSSYSTIQSFRIVSVPAVGTLKQGTTVLSAGSLVTASGNQVTLTYEPASSDFYGSASGNFVAIDAQGIESAQFIYLFSINQAQRPSTTSIGWQNGYAGVDNYIDHAMSAVPYNGLPENAVTGFRIVELPNPAVGVLTDLSNNPLTVNQVVPAVAGSATVRFKQSVETVSSALGGTYTAVSATGYEDLTPAQFKFAFREPRPTSDGGYFYGNEGDTLFTSSFSYGSEYPVDYVTLSLVGNIATKATFEFLHNGIVFQPGDQLEIDRTEGTNTYVLENITVNVTWIDQNAFGVLDGFRFTGTDTIGRSGVGTWRVFNLGAVNDAPVVQSSTVSGNNDVQITASIQGTDIDDNLSKFIILTVPTKGLLRNGATLLGPGSEISTGPTQSRTINLNYTANEGEFGTDQFTYRAQDASGAQSDIGTVTINVSQVIYPETSNVSTSTISNTPVNLTLTGTDSATSVTGFKIKTVPASGTLYLDSTALVIGSVVPATGNSTTIRYEPVFTYGGSASFTFAAISQVGKEDQTPASGSVTVTRVYYPTTNTASVSLDQNTEKTVAVSGSVTSSTITGFKIITLPANGSVKHGATVLSVGSVAPASSNAATLTYVTGSSSFIGSDSFTIAAVSAYGLEDLTPDTISVTVNEVFPAATSSNASTDQDTELNFNISGSITSGSIQSFTVLSLPANGTLYDGVTAVVINSVLSATAGAKTLRFVPNNGWSGATSFDFTATSALGKVDATPATISITIVADTAEVWMTSSSMTNNSSDLTVSTNYWLPS